MTVFTEQYLNSPIVRVNLEEGYKDILDEFFRFIVDSGVEQFKIVEERSKHQTCVFELYKGVPVVDKVKSILSYYSYHFVEEFLPEIAEKGIDEFVFDSSVNANSSWHGFAIHRHYPPYYMDPIDFTSVLYGMINTTYIPGKGSIYFWEQSKEDDNYEFLAIPDTIKYDLELFPTKYDLLFFTSDIWHQANRSTKPSRQMKLNRFSLTTELYVKTHG